MNRKGFTLVEMLVAVSIFSVVVTASTDVFIRAQRSNRQASALEKVQDTTRFILTRIAQDIRTGSIDYAYYLNPVNGLILSDSKTIVKSDAIISQTLALKNAEGKTILYTVRQKNHTDFGGVCGSSDATAPCLVISLVDVNQHERMTLDGYTITKLAFMITPSVDSLHVDPLINDYPSDVQPKVTILLTARGNVAGIRTPVDLSVQTTVSSRTYTR